MKQVVFRYIELCEHYQAYDVPAPPDEFNLYDILDWIESINELYTEMLDELAEEAPEDN